MMNETPSPPVPDAPPRLLRREDVLARLGIRKSKLYEMMQLGEFPRPLELSGNWRAWLESDVNAWIEARARERTPTVN